MQEWEQLALAQEATVSSLMEEAVTGMHQVLNHWLPDALPWLFLCGKGNNGNDGLWLAWLLEQEGKHVAAIRADSSSILPELEQGPVGTMAAKAMVWPERGLEAIYQDRPVIVVDALLGLGVKGAPRGVTAEIIRWASKRKKPTDIHVSVDIPSGLDADEGKVYPTAFLADHTCMIGAIKKGALEDNARVAVGQLHAIPISLQTPCPQKEEACFFDKQETRRIISLPHAATYKNRQGRLAIVGGCLGMSGAIVLAARAGLRSGSGLVHAFVPEEIIDLVAVQTPEVITQGVSGELLPDSILSMDAIVCGPGMGRSAQALCWLEMVLKKAQCPILLDADALNLLAENVDLLKEAQAPVVLTPHMGEMQRLLGKNFTERGQAIPEWLHLLEGMKDVTLVLKGPNTLVIGPRREISYNATGNFAMATAGMGDTLSGIIGGLCAQKYDPCKAARLGVWWHGASADHAMLKNRSITLLASDVIDSMGKAWQSIWV